MTTDTAESVQAELAAGRLDEAARLCQEGLARGDDAQLWRLLGAVSMSRSDGGAAIECFAKAARLDDGERALIAAQHADMFLATARNYFGQGNLPVAGVVADLLTVLQTGRDDVRVFLAELRLAQQRFDDCRALLDAVSAKPEPMVLAQAHVARCKLAMAHGNAADAVLAARKAVAIMPFFSPGVHRLLAQALQFAGRHGQAQVAIDWAQRHEAFIKLQGDDLAARYAGPDEGPEPPSHGGIWRGLAGAWLRIALFAVCAGAVASAVARTWPG